MTEFSKSRSLSPRLHSKFMDLRLFTTGWYGGGTCLIRDHTVDIAWVVLCNLSYEPNDVLPTSKEVVIVWREKPKLTLEEPYDKWRVKPKLLLVLDTDKFAYTLGLGKTVTIPWENPEDLVHCAQQVLHEVRPFFPSEIKV